MLEKDYLGRTLLDGPPPPPPPTGRRDHVGVHAQKDGRFYVGAAPVVGRVSAAPSWPASPTSPSPSAATGSGSPPSRSSSILDVPADRVDELVDGLSALGLEAGALARSAAAPWRAPASSTASSRSSRPRRRAATTVGRARGAAPHASTLPLTVHVNGCPNSCARIQVADLGFKGQIVTTDDGDQVEGFQVHLGGGLGLDAGFGRKLRGHKVTADELPDYVERVVRAFDDGRERRRDASPTGRPEPTRRCCDERGLDPSGALLLPVLRGGGPPSVGGRVTPRGSAVRAPASSRSTSSDWR